MGQNRVRVHLVETIAHSFIIEAPTDTDDNLTIADAAEGVFVHSTFEELEGYGSSITDRRFVYSEPAL